MMLVVSIIPVMYIDPNGESIIIALAIVGFIVWGGIGAYYSYQKEGEVNLQTTLLFAVVGAGVGSVAGAIYTAIGAIGVMNLGAYLSPAAITISVDGDPTNEIATAGEYISNSTLSNIYRNFLKGAYTDNPIGNGSTAAAIRHTLNTGQLVGNTNQL